MMFQCKLKDTLLLIALFLCTGLSARPSDVGVIVVAHGSKEGEWNQLVDRVVQQVHIEYPIEVAFLMNAPDDETLQDAVTRLEKQGARAIIVVPFLVSSYSGHFEEIRYYLGLRSDPPEHVHSELLIHRAQLRLTPALDNDSVVAEILLGFAREISGDPAKETVVLVAHGPNEDDENRKWIQTLEEFGTYLKRKQPFRGAVAVTLRDDAPAPVRDAATQQLRKRVLEAGQGGTALVVPVLISSSFIQKRIQERLEGLSYRMNERGLASSPLSTECIRKRVLQAVKQSNYAASTARVAD